MTIYPFKYISPDMFIFWHYFTVYNVQHSYNTEYLCNLIKHFKLNKMEKSVKNVSSVFIIIIIIIIIIFIYQCHTTYRHRYIYTINNSSDHDTMSFCVSRNVVHIHIIQLLPYLGSSADTRCKLPKNENTCSWVNDYICLVFGNLHLVSAELPRYGNNCIMCIQMTAYLICRNDVFFFKRSTTIVQFCVNMIKRHCCRTTLLLESYTVKGWHMT